VSDMPPKRVAAASTKENEPAEIIEKDTEEVVTATKPAIVRGKKPAIANVAKKTVTIADEEDIPEINSEDIPDKPKKNGKGKANAVTNKKAAEKNSGKPAANVDDDEDLPEKNEGSSEHEEEETVNEEVHTDAPAPKAKGETKKAEEKDEKMPPKRGRKAAEKEESIDDVGLGAEEEDTTQEPVVKGKPGRKPAVAKGKKGKETEDDDKEKEAEVVPKGRGKRGATTAAKSADKEDEVIEDEKPVTAPAKGKKGVEPSEDEPEKKKLKKDEEKKKPVGRGRGKKAAEPEPENEEQEEEKEAAKPEAKPAKGRGKKAVAEKEEEEEDVKADEVKPAGRAKRAAASKAQETMKKVADEEKNVAKSAPKRGRGKKAVDADDDEEDATSSKQVKKEDEENGKSGGKSMAKSIRRVQVKGKAAVDPLCTRKAATSHVWVDGELIYDVMLNQTNIGNNNNKYYVIQLLEDDSKNEYSVWFRWGRVGYDGQNKLVECGTNVQKAIKEFSDKFEAKTKNTWPTAFSDFETYPGKYTMIEMDYGAGSNDGEKAIKMEEEQEEEESKCKVESKLDSRVQQLMHLICSIRTMTQAVKDLEFDAEKSPLGKITQQQIKEGYACLQRVEEFIKEEKFGADFKQAVNEYYTNIPHACGFRPPALIKTPKQLKNEIQLLDLLSDIEYAIKTMKQETKEEDVHPVDRHYASLKCELNPLEKKEEEFEVISEYLKKTHGDTHAFEMQLQNVFRVEREGEEDNEEMMKRIGNRRLLWHGSRLSNFFGILSQGLRIAPPEAPCTGYMFGKGVYFADMASKSGGYCFASEDGQTAFLLLAEVALGEENQLKDADYNANKLPSNKQSTWGVGRTMPNPKEEKQILDNVTVPCGKPIPNLLGKDGSLLYNEFIVYNTQQIRLRYLVEVKFSFI
ncbi:hypothetical protein PFISCL1PPCAC_24917, partial [Pristionchus fissidentatus]